MFPSDLGPKLGQITSYILQNPIPEEHRNKTKKLPFFKTTLINRIVENCSVSLKNFQFCTSSHMLQCLKMHRCFLIFRNYSNTRTLMIARKPYEGLTTPLTYQQYNFGNIINQCHLTIHQTDKIKQSQTLNPFRFPIYSLKLIFPSLYILPVKNFLNRFSNSFLRSCRVPSTFTPLINPGYNLENRIILTNDQPYTNRCNAITRVNVIQWDFPSFPIPIPNLSNFIRANRVKKKNSPYDKKKFYTTQ